MCGIAALIAARPGAPLRRIASILDPLVPRGPDGAGFLLWPDPQGQALPLAHADTPAAAARAPAGYAPRGPLASADWSAARVAFGHRRLSILDLSPSGHQPMSHAGGRYWITYNGEVYNYRELRAELEALGHRFVSTSDTEVVLAAYAAWGRACLPRLRGMWAFALLDTVEETVLLARDPFGIKPLYYTPWEGGLAVASELKALRALPQVSARVQPTLLLDYLRTGVTDYGGATLYAAIRQLPPASSLLLRLGEPPSEPLSYWHLEPGARLELSPGEAVRRLRELFLESVSLHLRSDVPVGSCLSGGIDSSSIVGAMRHLVPEVELHTFSYCEDDPRIGEERWAQLAARASGATMHTIRAGPADLRRDLDALIAAQDIPFGSTSIYAQFCVFRRVQEAGIKVMLDGQGADELLGGYAPYVGARLASLLRHGRAGASLRYLRAVLARPEVDRRLLVRSAFGQTLPRAGRRLMRRLLREERQPPWLEARWFLDRGVTLDPLHESPGGPDRLRAVLGEHLRATSVPMLLRYEDRNAMRFSVESRVPFLDVPLVEFLHALPEELIVGPAGVTKQVMRAAMRGLVPDAILDRQDKVGFATAEQRWLEHLRPWVDELLAGDTLRALPVLRQGAVQAEWARIRAGKRFDWRVWRWLNLIRWSELSGADYS